MPVLPAPVAQAQVAGQAIEVAYADFTELVYDNGRRKAYLMPNVEHGSKMALGWAVTELALQAWKLAKQTLIGYGVDLQGFVVHHDQDPVFAGYGWAGQLLLEDHMRVSHALNGARDNQEIESCISRFKTEKRSLLLDAQTLEDLQGMAGERMGYHNGERRHSTIGYRAPAAYVATLSNGRSLSCLHLWRRHRWRSGQGTTIPSP